MKSQILKCIKHINNQRQLKLRILGRKDDILKIMKIYTFYKKYNSHKSSKSSESHTSEKKNNNTRPQIINKNGYRFILIDNKYFKLTKKNYTEQDMDNWCNSRLNVSKKMKERRQRAACEKNEEVNKIYTRECNRYPIELRNLLLNIDN